MIVILLLIVSVVAIHFYINHLMDQNSGWTVYPSLSALPQGTEFNDGGNFLAEIRILSVLQGAMIALIIFFAIKKK